MCQRARGSLEEATKLGSDRPVGGGQPKGQGWQSLDENEEGGHLVAGD